MQTGDDDAVWLMQVKLLLLILGFPRMHPFSLTLGFNAVFAQFYIYLCVCVCVCVCFN